MNFCSEISWKFYAKNEWSRICNCYICNCIDEFQLDGWLFHYSLDLKARWLEWNGRQIGFNRIRRLFILCAIHIFNQNSWTVPRGDRNKYIVRRSWHATVIICALNFWTNLNCGYLVDMQLISNSKLSRGKIMFWLIAWDNFSASLTVQSYKETMMLLSESCPWYCALCGDSMLCSLPMIFVPVISHHIHFQ